MFGSIAFHSRLQLKCMERGDRLANRWVMCGLWMTSSGALRESLSEGQINPRSTNHFREKLEKKFLDPLSECKFYRFTYYKEERKIYSTALREYSLFPAFHFRLQSCVRSLIATCGNYTQAQNCVNIFCDLYKSYPVAYLKYYHAIMKYSNAACLLPGR